MTCRAKIVTHTQEDFWVAGDSLLSVGVAAYASGNLRPSIAMFRGAYQVAESSPQLTLDRSCRIPSDNYLLTANVDPGTYSFIASVSSDSGSDFYNATIRVFDRPTLTVSVDDQGELNSALATAKSGSHSHVKIILGPGVYAYPSGSTYDLREKDTLVSFEGISAGVQFLASVANIKWAYWYSCSFTNTIGTAFVAQKGSHHVIERCSFLSSPTALVADPTSFVRVEDCHVANVITGLVGVKVVRGLSWTRIWGVAFHNCGTIDGTTGFRDTTPSEDEASLAAWCIYSGNQEAGFIRNNVEIASYAAIMRSDAHTGLVMVGNTFTTSAKDPVILKALSKSILAYNTVNHTGSGQTITGSGSATSNLIVNNWFTNVDNSARRLASSGVWEGNGSTSKTIIGSSGLQGADPGFSNNYMFLSNTSPLRGAGVAMPSVNSVLGIKTAGQIGALPYHRDTGLSSIYSYVLRDPAFSYIGPAVE